MASSNLASAHDSERIGVGARHPQNGRVSFARHLLVDGANILHAWPELRAVLKRDRHAARSQLVQRLAAIHDVEQARVTIVFDGRGTEIVVEQPFEESTFAVVFTPSSLSADDVIEQLVGKAADAASCLVATDDRAERETVTAAGATALSADELAAWLRKVEARQTGALAARRTENSRKWKERS